MVRPIGTQSVFKQLPWEDQMQAIKIHIMYNIYPECILANGTVNERKARKRGFRKIVENFKVENGQLKILKVRRRYKDSTSESEYSQAIKICRMERL